MTCCLIDSGKNEFEMGVGRDGECVYSIRGSVIEKCVQTGMGESGGSSLSLGRSACTFTLAYSLLCTTYMPKMFFFYRLYLN